MDRKPAMRIHTPPQMRRVAHVLPHMIVSTIVFIVALLAVLWFRSVLQAAPYRQTIVIAGIPTHILSVNAAKSNVTLIDIPEDTVISAVKGMAITGALTHNTRWHRYPSWDTCDRKPK